jgi:type IV secretory pathway VirJ component
MKIIIATLLLITQIQAWCAIQMGDGETFKFTDIGTVTVYRPKGPAQAVVIFLSGDGGWKLGVKDMAQIVWEKDSLVVGIDTPAFLKMMEKSREKCAYPAATLESLSHMIQKKFQFPSYLTPILFGYSSGATLSYAILAQSPPNPFAGAISLGFCPDLPIKKGFCHGHGLQWSFEQKKKIDFKPTHNLENEWYVLHGQVDKVCTASDTQQFVQAVGHGHLQILPKVGHGFSHQPNWVPQMTDVYQQLLDQTAKSAPTDDISGFPLVEYAVDTNSKDYFVFLISGDGGWAGIDKDLAKALSTDGIPVVGLNSLRYFWKEKKPEDLSKDFAQIINYYQKKWQKRKVITIGYSLGADSLPFALSRLTKNQDQDILRYVFLGPSPTVDLEIYATQWLYEKKGRYDVASEIKKLNQDKILCFMGNDEKDSLCKQLPSKTMVQMKGGHHFGGDYEALARTIINKI